MAGRFHGLEVVRDRRVDAGVKSGRHDLRFRVEALGPGARLGCAVPIEWRHFVGVVRYLQAYRVDVRQHRLERNDLGLGAQTELVGLLQRSHRIAARSRDRDDVGSGIGCGEQERCEVGGIRRKHGVTDDLPAVELHLLRCVPRQGVTIGLIDRQEVPLRPARLGHGLRRGFREIVGVDRPLDRERRAGLAVEIRRGRAGQQHDLALLAQPYSARRSRSASPACRRSRRHLRRRTSAQRFAIRYRAYRCDRPR